MTIGIKVRHTAYILLNHSSISFSKKFIDSILHFTRPRRAKIIAIYIIKLDTYWKNDIQVAENKDHQ